MKILTRKLSRRGFLSVLSYAVASIGMLSKSVAQGTVGFEKSSLSIKTSKGVHKFSVELALTNQQQAQGLMFRRTMAADAGMLFDYRIPQRITMWMKNTYLPLDMIFIGKDGKVVNIVQRAIPHSEAVISSNGRVRAVLEVNGGTVSRLGIKPGDQVLHSIFGTEP